MAHFLLLSYSFEQLFASVLPSSRELSSEVYSFQLLGKRKPMQEVQAPLNGKEIRTLLSSDGREEVPLQ